MFETKFLSTDNWGALPLWLRAKHKVKVTSKFQQMCRPVDCRNSSFRTDFWFRSI